MQDDDIETRSWHNAVTRNKPKERSEPKPPQKPEQSPPKNEGHK